MRDPNKKKYTIIGIVAVVVILVIVFLVTRQRTPSLSQQSSTAVLSETTKAKAVANINKTFTFSAVNQAKQKKDVSFTITSVERKDEIKVQGETRKANKNIDFLLVRIEIENTLTERLAIASADLIRLEDERGKLYSPDYHNGNVILDPISVKKDLISFVVDSRAKNFTLQVGELEGEKEKVEVKF